MIQIRNWCTPGPYAEIARKNRELSLGLRNLKEPLDFQTIEVPTAGTWVQNTCLKPQVAIRAIKSVPQGEGVLLLDADATLQLEPEWQPLKSMFFGYVRWKRPSNGALIALSGTLWLTHTAACLQFVEDWGARCQLDNSKWDQAHMWESIKSYVAGPGMPDVGELDWRFAWMEGNSIEPKKDAWIVHAQASRSLKDAITQPNEAPINTDNDTTFKQKGSASDADVGNQPATQNVQAGSKKHRKQG